MPDWHNSDLEDSVDESTVNELLKYIKALVVLQIQALNKTEDHVKLELLLARAGLPVRDIAELLGKSQAAVAKAIQRGGKDAA
jgi:DNA-directed RNA polymerase specialized sigma24 family protein